MTEQVRLQPRDHHSVYINGRMTAVTVEWPIWDRFKAIAAIEGVTIGNLLAAIDRTMRLEPPMGKRRVVRSLSSAIRIFVFEHSELKIKRRAILPRSAEALARRSSNPST
jgi:predicted DNA-binding ribbon-helix-helix protein